MKTDNVKLWNAYVGLVEGIDGIYSEHGELPASYWKEGAYDRIESIMNSQPTSAGTDIADSMRELLDGLDGATSSGAVRVGRYFSRTAIKAAKEALANS